MSGSRFRLGSLLALALLASLLGGCGSKVINRAPVEDRGMVIAPSKPVVVVPDPTPAPSQVKQLPGWENAGKPGYYTVKPGDTLIRIGLDHGQGAKDIARWSGVENPNRIEVGQVLRVEPPVGSAVISKPVLAAIHNTCIGGGVDMVCCADIRYGSADAWFSVKEIDLGMVADVGTLQRLPRLIGDGLVRELAYTGRRMDAAEALQSGLLTRIFPDRESLLAGVLEIARTIAARSPLAVRGTKELILFGRDHSVEDGLRYIANWNAGMLSTDDLSRSLVSGGKPEGIEYPD